MTTSNARQFEMAIDIDAAPDTVWQAITNDVELRRWFAPQANVVPGEGGSIDWTWEEHHSWPQTIEVWEPGTRLRTRYDSPVADGQGGKVPLFIDFQLEGRGGKTTLRLVHSGFGPEAEFDNEYDGISHGWPVELRSLKLYVEQHFGQDRQLAWSTLPNYAGSAEEAWEKITGPQGLNCGANIAEAEIGAPFEFTTADGDRFAGSALKCCQREFTGVVDTHGKSFLRVCVYDLPHFKTIWFWMASYGDGAQAADGLQSRFDKMLGRLFPDSLEDAAGKQANAKESVSS